MERNLKSYETLEHNIINYISKGKKLFENNKIHKAFEMFDKALELNNDYAEIYLAKGEAYIQMFELSEAKKMHKKNILE
ncbi:tetratricopeptide repeat protein [Clostridium haemolyticum]|uniref:tetratricopeptide repeat protein n=1 Tax=Clostridium haemolyticum TaxID=84025 RepID=UPI001FA92BF1|nr:tetratricopeptide repeat protein [Clostridium haemolyticum]